MFILAVNLNNAILANVDDHTVLYVVKELIAEAGIANLVKRAM